MAKVSGAFRNKIFWKYHLQITIKNTRKVAFKEILKGRWRYKTLNVSNILLYKN